MATPYGKAQWQEAAKESVRTVLRNNLTEMLISTDEPQVFAATILEALERADDDVIMMVRLGWTNVLKARQESTTNVGIVAALVASVSVGLSVQKLSPPDADDAWSASRSSMADFYNVLVAVAGVLALVSTAMSLIWVNFSNLFILNADDCLWFFRTARPLLIDAVLCLCNVCLMVSVIVGSTAINTDIAASWNFWIVLTLTLLFTVWYVRIYIKAKQREFSNNSFLAAAAAEVVKDMGLHAEVPVGDGVPLVPLRAS